MQSFRRRLAWMLGMWLLFEAAGFAMPLTLASFGTPQANLCTCPGGDHGAACPMHHRDDGAQASTAGRDARTCVVRSASAPGDVALLSLAMAVGPQPSGLAAIEPATIGEHIHAVSTASSSVSPLPVSPPPRA